MKIKVPTTLQELAMHLSKPIYLVGGFVRNSILFGGRDDTDIDICGSLTPDEIISQLHGIAETRDINPRIGTVLILYKDSAYEYTTFRSDSYPIGGQHCPSEVTFVNDITIDVKRRDFTVNAIYTEVLSGEVVDVVGGIEDIRNKLIRTVRSPMETFSEDGLRLLRLVRFACELGFEIEKSTWLGARESRKQLLDISGERKREELNKILNSDFKYSISGKPSYGLKLMAKLGLWENIDIFEPCMKAMDDKQSEFEILDKVSQGIRVEVLAILISGSYTDDTAERAFGAYGLRYPKNIVKNIRTAIDFVTNTLSGAELMLFIAKNRNYVKSLDKLSKVYDKGVDVLAIYNEMVEKHLPFELKELNVKEEDFIRFGVKARSRGMALNEIMLESYRQKKVLTEADKQLILTKFKEE